MVNLVSVIITTYKRPIEVIKRAGDSVVNQSYRPMELIIVIDYPADVELSKCIADTLGVYHAQMLIEYILMEHNSGACTARNRGIGHSQRDYLAFLMMM